ncbi:deoxyuridine triphosphatase [Gallid alphaherpesvirus 1]|uniref:Deoxyuridine triphosphatase n=1 Tax=Infectious laryngotracheitis virus TaxID=10386 RepID=A0A0K0K704_ILTV|nr:deoxyuridine triphosphatase [Gallid alphaherpesvirus 1]
MEMEMTTEKNALIEIGSGWDIFGLDSLQCVITNVEATIAKTRTDSPVLRIDSAIRTSLPVGYGIVISDVEGHAACYQIIPGLVDADYTGLLGILVVLVNDGGNVLTGTETRDGNVIFPPGTVRARLNVIKLANDSMLSKCGTGCARLLLETADSFQGEDDYLGEGFEKCISSLLSIPPDILRAKITIPGNIGCMGCTTFYRRTFEELQEQDAACNERIVILNGATPENINRFCGASNIKFVAQVRHHIIVGATRSLVKDQTVELRSDPDCPAALFPFNEIFAPKRPGDGGYDIRATKDVTILPKSSTRITLPQKLACGPLWRAFILGRSSMNLKGLLVDPIHVQDNDWISFSLTNIRDEAASIHAGDRVAQLIVTEKRSTFLGEPDALRWKIVNSVVDERYTLSVRGDGGFGSTGK